MANKDIIQKYCDRYALHFRTYKELCTIYGAEEWEGIDCAGMDMVPGEDALSLS